jgi:hypothetical protein
MLYLATKVTALGICRPPLGKVRRCYVIRKNSDLCTVRYRDGWERRTCEENVRNTSGPLNLTTHGSQGAEFNSRASQHLRWPIAISLAQAVEIYSLGSVYFYKSLGKNRIRIFVDCTENLIPSPKKGGTKLTNKT